MYIKNNTAKQFVFDFIDSTSRKNILDFACGTCSPWVEYLRKNTDVIYHGIDYNAASIARAHELFPEKKNTILLQDWQEKFDLATKKFDIVSTFSSLEHVVDRKKFITNMISYLQDDGFLILNYDSGHFRTGKIKDLILNTLSVVLSFFKIEKYYTKYVQEDEILSILQECWIKILDKKYFNLPLLKDIHKKIDTEILLTKWYEYEKDLNDFSSKEFLEKIFTSTVIIWKKWE